MKLTRRSFAFGASAAIAMPHVARAQTITDSAGRSIPVPAKVSRIFPAGPPAAITHYTLQPRTLLGWPRANRGPELVYLDPEVGARPELGRLTGRGNTTNLEVLLQLKPDLILDIGSTARTFAETADRVQAQTGIPYALLDGRFGAIPESYRLHGRLVGETARAEDLAGYKVWVTDKNKAAIALSRKHRLERLPWEVVEADFPHSAADGADALEDRGERRRIRLLRAGLAPAQDDQCGSRVQRDAYHFDLGRLAVIVATGCCCAQSGLPLVEAALGRRREPVELCAPLAGPLDRGAHGAPHRIAFIAERVDLEGHVDLPVGRVRLDTVVGLLRTPGVRKRYLRNWRDAEAEDLGLSSGQGHGEHSKKRERESDHGRDLSMEPTFPRRTPVGGQFLPDFRLSTR